MSTGYVFQTLDVEKITEIYRITSRSTDWKSAIDQILKYARKFFIFDNIAVYFSQSTQDHMDVIFARATGRGRSKEADVSWGETIANRVVCEKIQSLKSLQIKARWIDYAHRIYLAFHFLFRSL